MSACIEQNGGRVVDAVGDNLLAEFESAVDAVQCAVGIQKELKDKNQKLHEDKRLVFRIGVTLVMSFKTETESLVRGSILQQE